MVLRDETKQEAPSFLVGDTNPSMANHSAGFTEEGTSPLPFVTHPSHTGFHHPSIPGVASGIRLCSQSGSATASSELDHHMSPGMDELDAGIPQREGVELVPILANLQQCAASPAPHHTIVSSKCLPAAGESGARKRQTDEKQA